MERKEGIIEKMKRKFREAVKFAWEFAWRVMAKIEGNK